MLSSLRHWTLLLANFIVLALMIPLMPDLSARPPSLSLAPSIVNRSVTAGLSRNWSGYSATGGLFTSVTGTWTVPRISNSGFPAVDATWVGIGGITSGDLLQSGTQDVISSGQVVHLAFFEMLPNAPLGIPMAIQGGDSITVAITRLSGDQWQISFKDNTSGRTARLAATYHSSLSSAEWVEEAPSRGGRILPLADFGTVVFRNGSTLENQSHVTIAQSHAQPVIMVNSSGQALATPSSLRGGAGFSVKRSSIP